MEKTPDMFDHVITNKRLREMRKTAHKTGKRVPTYHELLRHIRDDCPECGNAFTPTDPTGKDRLRAPSLQHWPDGNISIICTSCNASLGNLKDPNALAAKLPPGHRHCPNCKTTKPRDQFHANTNRRSNAQAYCKPCNTEQQRTYYAGHKEDYKRRDRRRTARRRLERMTSAFERAISAAISAPSSATIGTPRRGQRRQEETAPQGDQRPKEAKKALRPTCEAQPAEQEKATAPQRRTPTQTTAPAS